MLDALIQGLSLVLQWNAFSLMLVGMALGFVVGLLPGIGGAATLVANRAAAAVSSSAVFFMVRLLLCGCVGLRLGNENGYFFGGGGGTWVSHQSNLVEPRRALGPGLSD